MKLEGKLAYEGPSGEEEIFVFYGHNPHNGEPWKPLEIRVKKGSRDAEELKTSTMKEQVSLEIRSP